MLYLRSINLTNKNKALQKMENLDGFKFQIITTKENQEFNLPLVSNRLIKVPSALKYNFTVYWGDGTSTKITKYNQLDKLHTYSEKGTYEVLICGTCDGWNFNNSKSALLVTKIISWGGADFDGFGYLEYAFAGCKNLVSVPQNSSIKVSAPILNVNGMFSDCFKLKYVDGMIFYNLSYAENFNRVFFNCKFLAKPPVDLFVKNTNALYFKETFAGCEDVIIIPTKIFWENKRAIDFSYTFSASGLKVIPKNLFKYNIDAKFFDGTFSLCYNLKDIPKGLFYSNTLAETFANCFYKDICITTYDKNVFLYNKMIKNLSNCFAQCNSNLLLRIASDLNKYILIKDKVC